MRANCRRNARRACAALLTASSVLSRSDRRLVGANQLAFRQHVSRHRVADLISICVGTERERCVETEQLEVVMGRGGAVNTAARRARPLEVEVSVVLTSASGLYSSIRVNIRSSTTNLDDILIALADPTRRAILGLLSLGDARVTDVAEPFPISLNSVSKHIRLLERASLVRRHVHGREHILSFNVHPLDSAAEWIESHRALWIGRLRALDGLLKQEDRERRRRKRKRGDR
jgi:DNA-binding transcriptional ArsR family regulator